MSTEKTLPPPLYGRDEEWRDSCDEYPGNRLVTTSSVRMLTLLCPGYYSLFLRSSPGPALAAPPVPDQSQKVSLLTFFLCFNYFIHFTFVPLVYPIDFDLC